MKRNENNECPACNSEDNPQEWCSPECMRKDVWRNSIGVGYSLIPVYVDQSIIAATQDEFVYSINYIEPKREKRKLTFWQRVRKFIVE